MEQEHCNRSACFYCAKGKCVSLSALTAKKCDHFLHRKLSRTHPVPRAENLAALRAHIEAHAPAMPAQDANRHAIH